MNVSPKDLLQTVLSDLEQGEIKADGLIVLTVNRPEGEDWNVEAYRCHMNRTDEIAFLELFKDMAIQRWKDAVYD